MTHLDDEFLQECPECGGDGGFDEPAAWTPTWTKCKHCDGKGELVVEYQQPECWGDMWEQWAESLIGAIGDGP